MSHPLVKLARQAIKTYLTTGRVIEVKPTEVPSEYHRRGGVFVTLTTKADHLRGCIGDIISTEPIYQNVVRNAINAAVNDPRFPPLALGQLDDIKISISIVNPPKEFFYNTTEELFNFLGQEKPGVIIKSGHHQALFLPSVWDDLPEVKKFLSALCLKAGLEPNCWQDPELQVFTFTTQTISE